ncbi:MAG: hypothetical protein ACRYGP_32920 [Janthinobacterium lividum]
MGIANTKTTKGPHGPKNSIVANNVPLPPRRDPTVIADRSILPVTAKQAEQPVNPPAVSALPTKAAVLQWQTNPIGAPLLTDGEAKALAAPDTVGLTTTTASAPTLDSGSTAPAPPNLAGTSIETRAVSLPAAINEGSMETVAVAQSSNTKDLESLHRTAVHANTQTPVSIRLLTDLVLACIVAVLIHYSKRSAEVTLLGDAMQNRPNTNQGGDQVSASGQLGSINEHFGERLTTVRHSKPAISV